jgi:hypothetical protein
MGEKTGAGQALGDRTLRGGRLMDGPARLAAIARPADADDAKPCQHVIEHLADNLTDHMQRAANAMPSRFVTNHSMLSKQGNLT